MARRTGNKQVNGEKRDTLDDDLDLLFKLPLAEFTAARNTLAIQLKKSGRNNEAEFVKTLAKPSISAWAVNQLYWRHREAFARLLDSGERFRKAQSSSGARKVSDMRLALDARREALSELSDLASELVREAGHNPTQEFSRRIATTLEAMSAYSTHPHGPRPGRLTQDVDTLGFESLAGFVPSTGTRQLIKNEQTRKGTSAKSSSKLSATNKAEVANEAREREKDRQLAIAAAKASTQEARRLLAEARTKTQSLQAAHKKAHIESREAEKRKREAEAIFSKAKSDFEYATKRASNLAEQVNEAQEVLKEAQRTLNKTSQELEKLFRSPNK